MGKKRDRDRESKTVYVKCIFVAMFVVWLFIIYHRLARAWSLAVLCVTDSRTLCLSAFYTTAVILLLLLSL